MVERNSKQEVRCPNGHTGCIRVRRVRNLWDHTFQMGDGTPATSELRRKVLTCWCDECQQAFTVEQRMAK